MTDERMTQGDVRLLRDALHEHQEAGSHSPTSICWYCDTLAERIAPVVERIVAARVGEVVERVEAVGSFDAYLAVAPMVRVRVMHEHDVRTALRAADAPVSDVPASGGRGDAGGDAEPADGGKRVDIVPGAVSPTEPNRRPR